MPIRTEKVGRLTNSNAPFEASAYRIDTSPQLDAFPTTWRSNSSDGLEARLPCGVHSQTGKTGFLTYQPIA